MKKNLFRGAAFFLLIIVLMCTVSACSSTELKNTDFEGGMTSSGGIADWKRYDYNGKMAEDNPFTEFSLADGVSGKAVCIYNKQLNDARIYQHVAAEKNSNYKVTAYIRTEDVGEEGAGANISVKDYSGTSMRIIGDTDWKEVSLYVSVQNVSGGFDICLCLGGYSAESTGKAYFDNVTVEEVDTIPEKADSVTVYQKGNSASSNDENENSGIAWLNNLFKVLFFGLMAGLAYYVITVAKKSDKMRAKAKLSMSESRGKADKKDWIIIAAMTLICGVISFVNLGDMAAASSYWKAQNDDEYVIVEFEEEKTVARYAYSSNIPTAGRYTVMYEDAETGEYKNAFTIEKGSFFEWVCKDISFTAKRVKVVATQAGLAVNEVGFFEKNAEGEYVQIPLTVVESQGEQAGKSGPPEALFDEQDTVPVTRTYMNGTYFDEIYFPRTAYENINGMSVYETTHPPLGKLFIALGIKLFGMNPFGWRCVGTFFGVLLVPIMYLFALKIFKKRLMAFTAAFLIMFDFMRFAQTRLATIDTYSVLFVMLMYYYMYDYFTTKSYDLTFVQSVKPLVFCGLAFGLGVACKWTSMYAGAGLAFLFFLAKYLEYMDVQKKRTKWPSGKKPWMLSNFLPTCLVCVVFFLLIPGIIYVLSYIPYKAGNPDDSLMTIVIENQFSMFDYHSNLNATHDFSSSWWQWPIMVRPIWYYVAPEAGEGLRATIVSFGNPAIWWVGIAAVVGSAVIAWKKKDKRMTVVFVAYALQYFPWILVTRCAFIYHYFTSVPFMILMIVYCIDYFMEKKRFSNPMLFVYLGLVFVLFVLFYPALSGMPVSENYIKALRWFPSWYF